jgi:putative heme-binding domain-containing protein
MTQVARRLAILLAFFIVSFASIVEAQKITLQKGDHIAYIGNATADRMQHHAWLETGIHAIHPDLDLTIRNLGFPGDELTHRQRSNNFGDPNQWLTKVKADVVFGFFGYNESFKGAAGIAKFKTDLAGTIDGMRGQNYNGKSAPRIVMFSPIAHENLRTHNLPDGAENNVNLELYTRAMQAVCQQKEVPFVDLYTPSRSLYATAAKPLTLNGIHLLDHGNKVLAEVMMRELFGARGSINKPVTQIARLRDAVLNKNLHWFSRYRVVDGYNVFGGRSKLNWHGQSNADVMRREMEIFDVLTANRDKKVWAVARGSDLKVKDDNLPKELEVKTNRPGQLEDGKHPYLTGQEGIAKMTIAKGMEVNLFASEEMFPELVNPVQMAVDPDGRLFVSVWPSYPHWNPTEPRRDRILCFPDENVDGVADKCTIFADKLNSVTGFEFWGGGMLVAAPPEIWFLKDTDGDDKADVKIRMMHGMSSADTHHSANAVVVGPDGWMYWSRGIFNVASVETPTGTFRSGASGVHRFNPRTFQMEFHFPIGPNPHGDVFDKWGYQFANDGTGGTGSYVNIGKGIGNKKWFKKRVRPVPATGIISSSHFAPENQNNFLICNSIGVLGVLQHEVKYDGADITAVEIEPILLSTDPNFRPTDVEIGGDGALYVSDWSNVLIGHMQHNMRDPNRDHEHGRIYRVTAKGRPLLKPVKMKGKPIAEVCQNFFSQTNGVRYRARLELSGRDTDEATSEVAKFAATLDPSEVSDDHDEAQALLECLWVFEEHRIPNLELVNKIVNGAAEPKVRAAAIRTLGHWGERVKGWEDTLIAGARDQSGLVRAEAVKAAVSFTGVAAAEVIFEVATRPTDAELTTVLNYARGQINVDKVVADAQRTGVKLSAAAQRYVLLNASVSDLLKLERSPAVYQAILSRSNVPIQALNSSLIGLAEFQKKDKLEVLLGLIAEQDGVEQSPNLNDLGKLLAAQPAADLRAISDQLEDLATAGKSGSTRRWSYAAWIIAAQSADDALVVASKSKDRLREFLEAVPLVGDDKIRAGLYDRIRPLISDLPSTMTPEGPGGLQQKGIKVDYFFPSANNVALETLAKMNPKASGVVSEMTINVPQRKQADRFALRFTGNILAPKTGKYTFFTASDDGSRLYIGKRQVVNNDGLHGMVERSGTIDLTAGSHPIVVTYFDNGGGDGLIVSWSGPSIRKQKIPADRLAISGGETLHDTAIKALSSVPGREVDKVNAFTSLVKAGRNRPSSFEALLQIPIEHWPDKKIRPMLDNLVGFLTEIPASYRTSAPAINAVSLANRLSTRLTAAERSAVQNRLKNLDVRVIAIGTVPHRMIYDKELIAVQAGKPVEFRFSNSDDMPHNFAILKPGALEEVGKLAEETARTPDAIERHYIPVSDQILVGSKALSTGENQAIAFNVPNEPGVYPYVCTYPGHWRRMYGALYVVANIEEYQANPKAYLAANPLEIKDPLLKLNTRSRPWKFEELVGSVKPLPMRRNFKVGKELFKVASCVACHKLNDEGRVFGPDLTKLEPKKQTAAHILQSIIDPSKSIEDKYKSNIIILKSGRSITGMVVKETPDSIEIVVDPLAKAKPTVIKKSDIDERVAKNISIMPKGLLDKLSQEEILDLIGYVFAKGDKKHKLFMEHAH